MKRFISLIISLFIISTSFFCFYSSIDVFAATEAELNEKIEKLDQEISANKDKLNALKDKKEKQEEYLNTLETQIDSVESKVNALETQVQSLDKEIVSFDNQIKQLNNEISIIEDEIKLAKSEIVKTNNKIDSSKEELSAKLRASYINGNYSTIEILMGSDSLASFLTRIEMMRRMSEDDKKVIEGFTSQVKKLKKTQSELEDNKVKLDGKTAEVVTARESKVVKKKELLTKQKELDKSVVELEGNYVEVEKFLAEIDKSSAAYKNHIAKLQAEKAAADKEIEEIIKNYQATSQAVTEGTTLYASNADPNEPTAGTTRPPYTSNESWAWPLGSADVKISSGYGQRDPSISGWGNHGGIDVVGKEYGYIYNKPIYASRSGTVIAAVWSNSGYGNYVVIDHGDGFSTVYAHCNSLSVSKGQYVQKGQHIANVGSTGNSTGNHLHYEVRYNGSKQNPMNYVSMP